MEYQNVLVEQRGRVGLIILNRPRSLNALNEATMREVTSAAALFDRDPNIGAIVLTGSDKVFAAGADIKEMASQSSMDMYFSDWFSGWDRLTSVRTPIVAAVSGYALGGGCELAMMCDLLIAAESAKFGQPEITLGIIPGMGGSQRLTRAIGKAKAMDMILTGRYMDADEAERAGLVSRVVPDGMVLDEALEVAVSIASKSKAISMVAKETTNAAYETMLSHGLHHERRMFHALFDTADQKEGMSAFVQKRPPVFLHR